MRLTEEAKIVKSTKTGRHEYEYAEWYAEAYAKAYTEAYAKRSSDGYAEAYAEAYAENYVKGRTEERAKNVRNLLAFGLSMEQIAEAMHLTVEEINGLLNSSYN